MACLLLICRRLVRARYLSELSWKFDAGICGMGSKHNKGNNTLRKELLKVAMLVFTFLNHPYVSFADSIQKSISRYRSGDLNGAEDGIMTYLSRSQSPRNQAEAIKILGIIRYTKGDSNKAERHFKEALSLDSNLAIYPHETLDGRVVPFFEKIKKRALGVISKEQDSDGPIKAASKTSKKNASLNATIRIISTPVSGKVMIDGIYAGNSGQNLTVTPGSFTVEVIADGYEAERITYNLREGENRTLNIKLRRHKIPWATATSPAITSRNVESRAPSYTQRVRSVRQNDVESSSDSLDDLFSEQKPLGQASKQAFFNNNQTGGLTEFDRDLAYEQARVKREAGLKRMRRVRSSSPGVDQRKLSQTQSISTTQSSMRQGLSPNVSSGRNGLDTNNNNKRINESYTGDLYTPSVDNEEISYVPSDTQQVPQVSVSDSSDPLVRSQIAPSSRLRDSRQDTMASQGQYGYSATGPYPPTVYPTLVRPIPDPALRKEKADSDVGFPTVLPFGIGQFYQNRYVEGSVLFALQSGLLFLAIDRNAQANSQEISLEKYVDYNCSADQLIQDRIVRACLTYLEKEYQGIDKLRNESNYASIGFGVLALGGIIEALIWEPQVKHFKKNIRDGEKVRRSRRKIGSNTENAYDIYNQNIDESLNLEPIFMGQNRLSIGIKASYNF